MLINVKAITVESNSLHQLEDIPIISKCATKPRVKESNQINLVKKDIQTEIKLYTNVKIPTR
jgi:hypothetical protein